MFGSSSMQEEDRRCVCSKAVPLPSLRRYCRIALCDKGGIEEIRFVISERLAVKISGLTTGRRKDTVACGRIPFSGRSESWVEIRRSFCNQAEFK